MSLEEQVEEFKLMHHEKYDEATYKSFLKYWVAEIDGKQRYEAQPKFVLAGRLSTWAKNSKKYANNKKLDRFRSLASHINPLR